MYIHMYVYVETDSVSYTYMYMCVRYLLAVCMQSSVWQSVTVYAQVQNPCPYSTRAHSGLVCGCYKAQTYMYMSHCWICQCLSVSCSVLRQHAISMTTTVLSESDCHWQHIQ